MAAAIEAADLVVRYGQGEALNVERLEVPAGRVFVIMGPNGAGKSTLLRVLSCLQTPAHGSLSLGGENVDYRARALRRVYRRIAVVFQEPLLLDTSVYNNVVAGLRIRGTLIDRNVVRRWLSRFGVSHLTDRSARSLSGGEARRVGLARAFVLEPEILFLDEPFAALDPPTRDELLSDLKRVLTETQTTTIFVTHDRDEALALGDQVAVMMGGKIVQTGTPQQVFTSPVDETVARFVGVETVIPGRVRSVSDGLVRVAIDGRDVEVVGEASAGDEVLVCIRPEEVVLSRAEIGPTSMRNRLEGRVTSSTAMRYAHRIVVDCGVPLVALITRRSFAEMEISEGTPVVAGFKATAAHLIPKPSRSR